MKEKLAGSGAVTTAMAYAFCWQLPLLLASFGLGSFTFSMWLADYRWIFLTATVVLLGFAHWQNWKDPENSGPWSKRILHGTTVLSLGLIIYSIIFT